MFINYQLDGRSRRYDANEWIGIFQGGAKPSVGKGLRAFIDIEAFDNAGSSMGSQGLRASVGHVLDKPLVNYNGFYISTGRLVNSKTSTFIEEVDRLHHFIFYSAGLIHVFFLQ
jgi:hypothetical protein